MTFTI